SSRWWRLKMPSDTMTNRRAAAGRVSSAAESRASRAWTKFSVLSRAANAVTVFGVCPGWTMGRTRAPKMRVAARASGMCPAARAMIQAAEATGAARAFLEPDMSQAMQMRSGGEGTWRREVRVNGSAIG